MEMQEKYFVLIISHSVFRTLFTFSGNKIFNEFLEVNGVIMVVTPCRLANISKEYAVIIFKPETLVST
jgi:hypothetical protein